MILHVDMDAFYAAVEERENPQLRGKPVIVGGNAQKRGVVCAANYAARKYGVHSAMAAARAAQLCPQAIFLPVRMSLYAEVSAQIREIFHRFTPLVEPLSLDEAFLDVTGSESLFGPSHEIGSQIKQAISTEVGLVASVGVAPNKFLAKIASDLEKPNGFVIVPEHEIQQFLDPLPVGRLWGVGRVTGKRFDQLHVRTIKDLRELSLESLTRHFGQHGKHLWRLARGADDRPVVPDREAKSISHETTFAEDIREFESLLAWGMELSEHVARRLRRQQRRGRTVVLKLRYHDFETITRSLTLANPTNVTQHIYDAAHEMLRDRLPVRSLAVRLLGVGVTGLTSRRAQQLSLFDDQQTQSKLDVASDKIRDKFGTASIGRASGMLHRANYKPPPRLP